MTVAAIQSRGQYLTEAQCLSFTSEPLTSLGDNEVQIAVRSTTICGSDLHYFFHGRNGSIVPKQPLCLGHESSGDVVAIGAKVSDLEAGDRVAIEAGVPCSECEICREGRYNLCSSLRFRGSGAAFPHFQGMLQEHVNHPRQWVHLLPPALTYEDGALLEPLAVAIHAVRRASVQQGQACLVFGAGAIGLLCAAVAKHAGCGSVTMADIDKGRLDFAVTNGYADFTYVVEPRRGTNIEESLSIAKDTARHVNLLPSASASVVSRPRCVFECTGAESCVQASIYAASSGGKVLLVGMGTPNHTLPISEASAREIDLISTWRYSDCYPAAIKLMTLVRNKAAHVPDITQLITHRFEGLDRVSHAFQTARNTRDQDGNLVIKVALNSVSTDTK